MSEEEVAESSSPRLGWLEAYVAAARHLDYVAAGKEIGVHASNVQRNVARLQVWLHRILLLDGVPFVLPSDDGMPSFLPSAVAILEAFNAIGAGKDSASSPINLRRSNRSLIRFVDLETVVAVDRYANIEAAASHLRCSYKAVRRRVSAVEVALGSKVFTGRSRLSTSIIGKTLVPVAENMIALMQSARADVSRYDPERLLHERFHKMISSCRFALLSFMASNQSPRTKVDRIMVAEAKRLLAILCSTIDEHSTRHGPFRTSSASDIDMEALFVDRNS